MTVPLITESAARVESLVNSSGVTLIVGARRWSGNDNAGGTSSKIQEDDVLRRGLTVGLSAFVVDTQLGWGPRSQIVFYRWHGYVTSLGETSPMAEACGRRLRRYASRGTHIRRVVTAITARYAHDGVEDELRDLIAPAPMVVRAWAVGPIRTGWRGWTMDLHRDAADCLSWAIPATPAG
jgi:hypothetical protein